MKCEICGLQTNRDTEVCPACHELYLNDLHKNNFPKPLIDAGMRVSYFDWFEMKKLAHRLYCNGMSDEHVATKVNEWAEQRAHIYSQAQESLRREKAMQVAAMERLKNQTF